MKLCGVGEVLATVNVQSTVQLMAGSDEGLSENVGVSVTVTGVLIPTLVGATASDAQEMVGVAVVPGTVITTEQAAGIAFAV